MNEIGRKIFFDASTGNVILEKSEMEGHIVPETINDIIKKYNVLSDRNRETFDVLELPFGAYAQDFAESNGYRVNPETKTLEFSYPDPNAPEAPPVYQKPVSEQIEDVRLEMARGNSELFETMIMLTGGGF